MNIPVTGGCLCGAIKYSVEVMPDKIFNCHCQFCRRAHGADYATMALADGNTLKVEDPCGALKAHKNKLGGYRAFCSECGSRLMNYAPDKSFYLSVTLSTVDSPSNLKPIAHANIESKAPWCEPYDGVVSFPGMPPGVLEGVE